VGFAIWGVGSDVSVSREEPVFTNIAIVGLGLIGGSIALGVRERWPSVRITGVDQPSVLAHARGSGAIERAVTDIADIGGVDLVLLAAPVRQNVALQLQHLRTHPAVAAALARGRIALHGWVFDIGAGRVDVLDETTAALVPLECPEQAAA